MVLPVPVGLAVAVESPAVFFKIGPLVRACGVGCRGGRYGRCALAIVFFKLNFLVGGMWCLLSL